MKLRSLCASYMETRCLSVIGDKAAGQRRYGLAQGQFPLLARVIGLAWVQARHCSRLRLTKQTTPLHDPARLGQGPALIYARSHTSLGLEAWTRTRARARPSLEWPGQAEIQRARLCSRSCIMSCSQSFVSQLSLLQYKVDMTLNIVCASCNEVRQPADGLKLNLAQNVHRVRPPKLATLRLNWFSEFKIRINFQQQTYNISHHTLLNYFWRLKLSNLSQTHGVKLRQILTNFETCFLCKVSDHNVSFTSLQPRLYKAVGVRVHREGAVGLGLQLVRLAAGRIPKEA